jgi:CheY-like chemotaxis protein
MNSLNQPPAAAAGQFDVVVADDNHDAADSLVQLINSLGYAAVAVYSGVEAVQAQRRLMPALMLMDIQMPLMDGYEAARHIRDEGRPDCPRLAALTSLSSEQDRQKSLAAGFNVHLVKPIGMAQLGRLLEETGHRDVH